MTVAEVDALLYLPGHPREQLRGRCAIPALSPGWQASFRALLDETPGQRQRRPDRREPAPSVARLPPLRVTAIEHESDSVISIRLEDRRRRTRCPPPCRVSSSPCASIPTATPQSVLRSYSLSGPPDAGRLPDRREARARTARPAATSTAALRVGRSTRDRQHRAAPSSSTEPTRPVLLVSAGIGATPVLAMLHALARPNVPSARSGGCTAPATAPSTPSPPRRATLLAVAARTRAAHVCYSRPDARRSRCRQLRPRGPPHRVVARRARPTARGRGLRLRSDRVHGGDHRGPRGARPRRLPHPHRAVRARPSITPGIVAGARAAAAPSGGPPGHGPDGRVRPQRPRQSAWSDAGYASLLELAEACDVAGPLVVPHRRLPHLRDDAHRRRRRLRPRAGRGSRRAATCSSAAARPRDDVVLDL